MIKFHFILFQVYQINKAKILFTNKQIVADKTTVSKTFDLPRKCEHLHPIADVTTHTIAPTIIISILNNSLISEFSVNMNKRFEELSERINSLHDEKNEKIAQEVSRMKDLM